VAVRREGDRLIVSAVRETVADQDVAGALILILPDAMIETSELPNTLS
jgi:hypothetical protein